MKKEVGSGSIRQRYGSACHESPTLVKKNMDNYNDKITEILSDRTKEN
jgi:hypothetical protein